MQFAGCSRAQANRFVLKRWHSHSLHSVVAISAWALRQMNCCDRSLWLTGFKCCMPRCILSFASLQDQLQFDPTCDKRVFARFQQFPTAWQRCQPKLPSGERRSEFENSERSGNWLCLLLSLCWHILAFPTLVEGSLKVLIQCSHVLVNLSHQVDSS